MKLFWIIGGILLCRGVIAAPFACLRSSQNMQDTTYQWYCNDTLLIGQTNPDLKGRNNPGTYHYTRMAYVDNTPVGEFNITLRVGQGNTAPGEKPGPGTDTPEPGPFSLVYGMKIDTSWNSPIDQGILGQSISPDRKPDYGLSLTSGVYYGRSLLSGEHLKLYDYLWNKYHTYTIYDDSYGPILDYIDIYADGFRITKDELNRIQRYLSDDHPELFYVGNVVAYGMQGEHVRKIKVNYVSDRAETDRRMKLIHQGADKILAGVRENMTDYEKVKFIHDTFLANVSYGGMSSSGGGNIIGGLAEGKCVCEGYAHTMQYLCQRAGVQAIFLEGHANTSGTTWILHAWNILRINGQYYLLDATWDDNIAPGSTDCGYSYFLKSETTMLKDHTPLIHPSDINYGANASLLPFMLPLPECKIDYPHGLK